MARKCDYCKRQIDTPREHLHNIILFRDKYYHENCFLERREKMVKSNSKYRNDWENALQDIEKLKQDAEDMIDVVYARDDLNIHLLSHYDITAIPDRFWTVIGDVGNGRYNKKKCKPIPVTIIFECWKWGQRNLDKINVNNRVKHVGPQNDSERLYYDLSIILSKVPVFLKEQAKIKVASLEQQKEVLTKKDNVNYDAISSNKIDTNKSNHDIESLIDEIF